MTTPRPSAAAHPLMRRLLALGAVLAALLVTAVHAVPPAQAAGSVSVSSELGGAKASTTAPTRVSLSGSGFQSVQGGFGGIYVLFGSISDGWRPSEGGATGTDYQYVPDSETKDNQGYQRFVAFPGSSTAGAANGGELAADGTWNAEMIIPGPEFDSMDRDGNITRVNCLEVQCGIITIGAHGVKNANNETFTPIEFVGAAPAAEDEGDGASGDEAASEEGASAEDASLQQAAPAQAAPAPAAEGGEEGEGTTEGDGAEDPAASADGADDAAAAAELGEARVGLVSKDASQGGALSFTARGFLPGEQVVGTLDNGTSAAGPYHSGASGEIAGSLPIPADLRPGTHVITLTGAASEQTARASFTVTAGAPAGATVQADDVGSLGAWDIVMIVVLILLGLVLLVLLVAVIPSLVRLIARRRAAKRAAAAAEAAAREAERAPLPGSGCGPARATPRRTVRCRLRRSLRTPPGPVRRPTRPAGCGPRPRAAHPRRRLRPLPLGGDARRGGGGRRRRDRARGRDPRRDRRVAGGHERGNVLASERRVRRRRLLRRLQLPRRRRRPGHDVESRVDR